MKTALTYIAESMIKAVGVAGIEAMAMKNTIYALWRPRAEVFYDDILDQCFNFGDEEIRAEYADSVFAIHRLNMTDDFIEAALPYVEEYVGYAWDRGREDAFGYTLSGLLPLQKNAEDLQEHQWYTRFQVDQGVMARGSIDYPVVPFSSYPVRYYSDYPVGPFPSSSHPIRKDQESIITDLVSLTGSTKANVQRTIKRWFKQTQGQYFERYIVPETARLLSHEEGVSLRSIGSKYKEFVQGEGYWSSVSEFNSESSKVFSQVQALHEMNVSTYTIEATLDDTTCDVCVFMNGSTWSVSEAVSKVYDILISEAEELPDINPFPPRSTPKDFESPADSPFNLPLYHPRCRCNVRSEHTITAMPQEVLARPFDVGPRPTNSILDKTFSQFVTRSSRSELAEIGIARPLTNAEWKIAKEAWESLPYEEKKWAIRNKQNFNIHAVTGDNTTSRVVGNNIEINAKYFDPERYGPQPIQHELRHALVNKPVLEARGGGETIWRELSQAAEDTKKGWRSPAHVNAMYQLNGNQGLRAASAASDEFLAMIGDHYQPNMSMTELIESVRHKRYGINVSDSIGSTLISSKSRWTAREAKNAVEYWWYIMDIDNNTLLSKKQMLAKLTYKPSTAQTRAIAINSELELRDSLRAAGVKKVNQEGDNAPFDVWIGADPNKYYAGTSKVKPWALIEVKTIIRAKNDKITMHKDSLARKRKEWRKFGTKKTKVYTVVFDERTGKTYIRDDVGSFRLSTMKEVTTEDLQRMFGGEAVDAITEAAPSTERLAAIQSASPRIRTQSASDLKTSSSLQEGNLNEVRIVTVGAGNKKYIFKPVSGESFFFDNINADKILEGVNTKFGTNLSRLEELTDSHWVYVADDLKLSMTDEMIRSSLDNFNVSLAQREAFALDVGQRLGFDNDHAVIPKFLIAENDDGSMAGVLIEFIENSQVEAKWTGTLLSPEERYQMAAFDYLIGNLDRHTSNWMRTRRGKPVYIDHGYSMPGQSLDLGGLSEWRAFEAEGVFEGFEGLMDDAWVQGLANRIENFVNKDAMKLAKSYGFNAEEIDAMLRRGDSLVERMRESSFSTLLYKHSEEYGLFSIDDSKIGG